MSVKVLLLSYRNYRNATSDVSFFSPNMENLRRGSTCACRCQNGSARRSRPTVMERFEASMFAYSMVGLLLQNIPM